MESRKRHFVDDTDYSSSKKRAMSSASGSPTHVNGTMDTVSTREPRDEDELERFRKGAIFRRMRHYARERDRCQRRVDELEQRKYVCEADMAAMDVCWTQLVESLKRLVNVEERRTDYHTSNDLDIDVPDDIKAHASHDVLEALQQRLQITKDIVATFVKVARSGGNMAQHSVPSQCQRSMSDCTKLQSELKFIQVKLKDAERDRKRFHEELQLVESRLQRMHSKTLSTAEMSEPRIRPKSEDSETSREAKGEEGPKEHEHVSPPPLQQSAVNGSQDLQDELYSERIKIENRDKRISELEAENATLQLELANIRSDFAALPEESIQETPCYKLLRDQASQYVHGEKVAREELTRVQNELTQLQESRQQWQEELITTTSKEAANLKQIVSKRDEDLLRIRQHRDQFETQIREMKAMLSGKWSSLDAFKTLAESRGERVIALTSEVARLRARLAAAAGDDDLLQFVFKDTELTLNYANDLKQRLAQSEAQSKALRKTLQERDPSQAALSLELANVRSQLISTEERLASYEADAADTRSMESQLKSSLEQIRVLKLKEAQSERESVEMATELEKLAAAWEALDRQVHNQAITVEKWEDEREKLNNARARSDNKYFKVMNEQEAKDTERKQLQRTLERQTKLMDNLTKSENDQKQRADALEKETGHYKKLTASQAEEIKKLDLQHSQVNVKAEESRKKLADYLERYKEREVTLTERSREITSLKDEITRLKRDVQKATERSRAAPAAPGATSEREAELQAEVDKCMRVLKCSTCHNAMRSTIIMKCMHTFCKGCVDARISHRQRKCPACGLAFAQSDVQTLYFQG